MGTVASSTTRASVPNARTTRPASSAASRRVSQVRTDAPPANHAVTHHGRRSGCPWCCGAGHDPSPSGRVSSRTRKRTAAHTARAAAAQAAAPRNNSATGATWRRVELIECPSRCCWTPAAPPPPARQAQAAVTACRCRGPRTAPPTRLRSCSRGRRRRTARRRDQRCRRRCRLTVMKATSAGAAYSAATGSLSPGAGAADSAGAISLPAQPLTMTNHIRAMTDGTPTCMWSSLLPQ